MVESNRYALESLQRWIKRASFPSFIRSSQRNISGMSALVSLLAQRDKGNEGSDSAQVVGGVGNVCYCVDGIVRFVDFPTGLYQIIASSNSFLVCSATFHQETASNS